MTAILEIVVLLGEAYLAIGVFFTIAFLTRGARVVDDAVTGSTWGFYCMILPGTIALWPVLVRGWLRRGTRGRP